LRSGGRVGNFDDNIGCFAAGERYGYFCVQRLAEQRASQGRVHADAAGFVGKFIRSDDTVAMAYAVLACHRHVRAEEHPLRITRRPAYHYHAFQALAQVPHPGIDFAQAAFTVGVVGVFRAITLRGGRRDRLRDPRAFDPPELLELGAQSGHACNCDVFRTLRLWRAIAGQTALRRGQMCSGSQRGRGRGAYARDPWVASTTPIL
jgi:hypothetical protein